jgi:hypothetical protein
MERMLAELVVPTVAMAATARAPEVSPELVQVLKVEPVVRTATRPVVAEAGLVATAGAVDRVAEVETTDLEAAVVPGPPAGAPT